MLVGGFCGVMTCYVANAYKLVQLDPKVYSISYVPFRIMVPDLLAVILTTFSISFVATIYPAYRACRLLPIDGLRYE